MDDAKARQIVLEAIEAHGGMAYWNSLQAVDAVISARGFLFTAKRRPVLQRVRMRAFCQEPRFQLFDHPQAGRTAELLGNAEVRIIGSDGKVEARRERPRDAFRGLGRIFRWDELDLIYFAGYATWNYLATPFLLARKGVVVETLAPLTGDMASLTRLKAIFPDDIPTHSREQIFYFDDQRLLRRLDYTAEVVGGWAHAAHLCGEYRTFGKLKAPAKRVVFPLPFGTRPMPGPKLVEIEVHELRPVAARD